MTTVWAGRFTPHASVAVQTKIYRGRGETTDAHQRLQTRPHRNDDKIDYCDYYSYSSHYSYDDDYYDDYYDNDNYS